MDKILHWYAEYHIQVTCATGFHHPKCRILWMSPTSRNHTGWAWCIAQSVAGFGGSTILGGRRPASSLFEQIYVHTDMYSLCTFCIRMYRMHNVQCQKICVWLYVSKFTIVCTMYTHIYVNVYDMWYVPYISRTIVHQVQVGCTWPPISAQPWGAFGTWQHRQSVTSLGW